MKLRFLKEQKEQTKAKAIKLSKKRAKFNLVDSSDEEGEAFTGFTHNGKALELIDDFQEEIDRSDSDEDKGQLNENFVEEMNFGGGEQDEEGAKAKKSRKEVFEEIMQKSKLFKAINAEQKEQDYLLR